MLGNTTCSLDTCMSHEMVIKKYNQKTGNHVLSNWIMVRICKKFDPTPFIVSSCTSAFSLSPLSLRFQDRSRLYTSSTMSLALSDNLAPQPITDIFTNDTNIDRRKCDRTVPMKVLSLGVGRTGTACEYLDRGFNR